MTRIELKKKWLAAAIVSGGIISAVFMYALVVEALRRFGATPPLASGPVSAALKYAFYIASIAAVFALKLVTARFNAAAAAPEATARALLMKSVITAAVCEVPAVMGLMLFILTGAYWDFYLLAVFSTVMELVNFPKPAEWEERMIAAHGQLEP